MCESNVPCCHSPGLQKVRVRMLQVDDPISLNAVDQQVPTRTRWLQNIGTHTARAQSCLQRTASEVNSTELSTSLMLSGRRTWQFNTTNTKAHHCRQSWASSIHLPSSRSISIRSILLINYLFGSRTQRFNNANTKAHHWTQSWASSIHLPSSQSISLTSIFLINWLCTTNCNNVHLNLTPSHPFLSVKRPCIKFPTHKFCPHLSSTCPVPLP
jgi:hypothetical protein